MMNELPDETSVDFADYVLDLTDDSTPPTSNEANCIIEWLGTIARCSLPGEEARLWLGVDASGLVSNPPPGRRDHGIVAGRVQVRPIHRM
jgi:hypothetical protein